MNDTISNVIVWASPFVAAGFLWLVIDKISETNKKIEDVHTTAKVTSNKVQEIEISVVKIQSDIHHIKESIPASEKEFENKVESIFENSAVRVIKNARKRFE